MKKAILPLILAGVMGLTACSASWLSTFDGYLAIAGPILVQILDIVALAKGTVPNAALQAKITADAASLKAIAASVSTASAANVQGACAQFNLGVQTFAGDLTAIEQIANVGGQTSTEVAAAVSIAQAAITEIEAPIASCQAAPTPAAAYKVLKAASVSVTSPEDVVKKFNAVVDNKHHVHYHNKVVRYLSFGHYQ